MLSSSYESKICTPYIYCWVLRDSMWFFVLYFRKKNGIFSSDSVCVKGKYVSWNFAKSMYVFRIGALAKKVYN